MRHRACVPCSAPARPAAAGPRRHDCSGAATRVFDFGGGFEPEQRHGAGWQLDAGAGYALTARWSMALGGANLADAYPGRCNEDIHSFGNVPYDVLTPLGSNGRHLHGRVRHAS